MFASVDGDHLARDLSGRGAGEEGGGPGDVVGPAGSIGEGGVDEAPAAVVVEDVAEEQRLARAEQAGLVERTRAPAGRERIVRLLPAGHEVVDRLVGSIAELDADLLAALDPAQRDALDVLLRTLLDDAERRFGAAPLSQVGVPPAPVDQ